MQATVRNGLSSAETYRKGGLTEGFCVESARCGKGNLKNRIGSGICQIVAIRGPILRIPVLPANRVVAVFPNSTRERRAIGGTFRGESGVVREPSLTGLVASVDAAIGGVIAAELRRAVHSGEILPKS